MARNWKILRHKNGPAVGKFSFTYQFFCINDLFNLQVSAVADEYLLNSHLNKYSSQKP